MPFAFAEPLVLLLVPVAVAFVVLLRRGPRDPVVRAVATGARALAVALLLVALAELQVRLVPEGTETAFVVDRSTSVPEAQQRLALDVVNAARRTMDPRRDRARLVVFGGDAVTEATLAPDQEVGEVRSVLDRGHTNVAGALRFALDGFEPGRRRRVVLISDGNETDGDARAVAAQAVVARTRVDVVPLEYAYPAELLVERLVVPSEARRGEPFRVRAVVQASRPAAADVVLLSDGRVVESRRRALGAGANVETFDLAVPDAGFHRLTCRVEPVDPADDAFPQNNEASGFVSLAGTAAVLYVHRDAEGARSPALVEALASQGIEVVETTGRLLPHEPGSLQRFDAVVLDDVPSRELSRAQMEALELAVESQGMGLAMIGGEWSFGAGEWTDTPVEKVLPVLCDPGSTVVRPSIALVLCLDHSGSMGDPTADGRRKVDLAREGAALATEKLAPRDLVGVVAFDDAFAWVAPLARRAEHGPGLERSIRAIEPGGGTNMAPALEACAGALARADAATKHVIVLTDGLSTPGDFAGIAARFKRDRVTVSTVAVGDDADVRLLEWMAQAGGGRFYAVKQASNLPRIFVQETLRVARGVIREVAFSPRVARPASEILGGLRAFPRLRGHVLTEAKPRADVLLVSDEGTPVLATAPYGLGRSLAFTSDGGSRWAVDWVSWEGFPGLWAKAVRHVSKAVEPDGFQVATRVEGARGTVVLDAVDRDGNLVESLAASASVRSPSDERIEVALRQVAPGRYEADFAARDVGAYSVSVRTRAGEGAWRHAATTGLVVPCSREYLRRTSNRGLLEDVARATGGAVVEPHVALHGPGARFRGFFAPEIDAEAVLVGVWPTLLALAVALFFVDVALRKLRIDLAGVRAWLAAATSRAPREPGARGASVERLLARKQEVREATAAPEVAPVPRPAVAAPPVADPPGSGRASPASFTERLLDAKKRAGDPRSGGRPS